MNAFIIREAIASDIPFIYATWLESYRYDSHFGKSHRNGVFFPAYRLVVDELLEKSKTIIACNQNSPENLFSYLVYEQPSIVHYAFTKGPFMRLGLFTALMKHAFGNDYKNKVLSYTHKTYLSIPVIDTFSDENLIFRGAELLFKKGDLRGKTKETTAA